VTEADADDVNVDGVVADEDAVKTTPVTIIISTH